MPKPAQRTHTSETKIKETTIHSGEDKQFELEERPPIPQPKSHGRSTRVPTPPPDTKTSKLNEPGLQTERHKIGSAPPPRATAPQGGTRSTHPRTQGTAPKSAPKAAPKKRKQKGLSLTSKLILIIICLLIAIVVAISLLNSIGNHGDKTVAAIVPQTPNLLLYLRQVVL